ncbi:helix-turn-helix domain-containing protein [Bifidobacterium catulorum]|uniref:XRE family transcriptional regulator n=1 Tax=Bifidobacterium catulorum TaxID=1630173 RepID=A0A2U2MQD7_9BIFI|nr:helix-turn-helix transcriptional regulator [Bifidobacterium catulorum]PWG59068.1 XRE family transcriptional regulator [Bifidobacterium catulorum]
MSLKSIRERRGYTQTALSEESGVNRVMINNYERGRKSPNSMTLDTAYRLADVLDCEPREFLK